MTKLLDPMYQYDHVEPPVPHPSGDHLPVGYMMECPGCLMGHIYWVVQTGNHPVWEFNGDLEKPTFNPSLRCRYGPMDNEQCCHFFVKDGEIRYEKDCTHHLKGQVVPMVPIDETLTQIERIRRRNDLLIGMG